MCAVQSGPSRCALTLPIISTAVSTVVAVASVDAVRAPLTRWTRLRAVAAYPPWIALTGPVDGVAGSIVGAAAAPGTVLPIESTGTHLIAQRPLEARQAITLPGHVMTRPVTVDTLWTRLTAAMAEVTWRTNSLARGPAEPRRTFTRALIRGTGSSVLAVTGQGTVRPPPALGTHTVTVNACPSGQTATVSSRVMASIRMAAVASLPAGESIGAVLTAQLTSLPPPPGGAGAAAVHRAAGASIATRTGEVTSQTPGPTRTVYGAVDAVPAWFAEAGAIHR